MAVTVTELCTRIRIVEQASRVRGARGYGLRLGLRAYGKRFVQILPHRMGAQLTEVPVSGVTSLRT